MRRRRPKPELDLVALETQAQADTLDTKACVPVLIAEIRRLRAVIGLLAVALGVESADGVEWDT